MPSRSVIDDFLRQPHLAVVGVSRRPKDFSRAVVDQLRRGDRVVDEVGRGDGMAATLSELGSVPDGVVVMVPASESLGVVEECVRLGVPRVWLHRGAGTGAVSAEAVERCTQAGIAVVDGACPLMFAGPVGGVHRLHGFFHRRKISA